MRNALAGALTRRWYAPRPAPLLIPLGWAFGAAVRARRLAYRRGWLRTVRAGAPVIVIGNLSVGGGGKTPLVIWCARLLREHGYRPAVLTRGYGGRPGAQPLVVTADSDPDLAGDEPVLIAAQTGVPVYAHPDRVRAATVAVDAGADVLVCDDGLQHLRLARDIAVVVVDGRRRFGNGALLPAGPLREPASHLAQVADLVVCKGGDARPGEIPMRYAEYRARPVGGGAAVPLTRFAPGPVHAVAGIADPDAFFAALADSGIELLAHPFADHHRFVPADLAFDDALAVLMTAKDAVKCRRFTDSRLWCVSHAVVLPPSFSSALLSRLEEVRHGG